MYKFIDQATRDHSQHGGRCKTDEDVDHHRAEGDWFNTYGDDRSKGGPFSALTPSMWPARGVGEVDYSDGNRQEFNDEEECIQYDEFGFR